VFHLVGSILCAFVIFNQTPTLSDSLFPVEKWNYESKGRRDPFVPLMGIELGGAGKLSHLSVENLTLIGILWGDRGYFGLVKDGLNNGYILKKGDKVAGGQVTQITNKAVIFEIMHAGVVTKYELRLEQNEGR
jgi:hypothetical protein